MREALLVPSILAIGVFGLLGVSAWGVQSIQQPKTIPASTFEFRDGFIIIDQPGYRVRSIRPAAISVTVEWTRHPATGRPGVTLLIGASEFRVDTDKAGASELAKLIREND